MSPKWEDELGKLFGSLFVVLIIVGTFLAIQATLLVIRVSVKHWDNRPLRVALACAGICVTAVCANGFRSQPLILLALVSVFALLVTAKAVEIYHDDLLQPEVDQDFLIEQVLHRPWIAI